MNKKVGAAFDKEGMEQSWNKESVGPMHLIVLLKDGRHVRPPPGIREQIRQLGKKVFLQESKIVGIVNPHLSHLLTLEHLDRGTIIWRDTGGIVTRSVEKPLFPEG